MSAAAVQNEHLAGLIANMMQQRKARLIGDDLEACSVSADTATSARNARNPASLQGFGLDSGKRAMGLEPTTLSLGS